MTKDDLKNYRHLKIEVQQLENEREKLYSIAERSVRSIDMAIGQSKKPDPLPGIIDELTELDKSIVQLTKRLIELLSCIEKEIDILPSFERTVIRGYYIEGRTWKKVAEKLNYSRRQIIRIKNAIFEKMSPNVTS